MLRIDAKKWAWHLLLWTLCLVPLAVCGASGEPRGLAEKSKSAQPLYLIHTSNDTVWARMTGQLEPIFIVSKMDNPYSGNVSFDNIYDTLVLFTGNDTATILPTSETIKLWVYSGKDTVQGTLNCSIATEYVALVDTAKLQILKRFSDFGHILPAGGARFKYALPSDSDLVKLRAILHLDSIAGTGDEFSRQRNLLRWLHKRVRHDGNSMNPSPANAEHIIEVCDSQNRGVNCRMLATALNEIYLAMGFKSRHLTCLPFDTLDRDCHVIDMVWSTQYGKWLYMDPTYDAYWVDKSSVPLSPWQVREAIVTGDSLIVNDSINWNGQRYMRQDYYNYMTKNLFRFSCPTESAFGYESRDTVGYISLQPSLYNPRLLGAVKRRGAGGVTNFYTDDPDWFFAPPK